LQVVFSLKKFDISPVAMEELDFTPWIKLISFEKYESIYTEI